MQAKAARFSASTQSIGSFDCILRQKSGISVAKDTQNSHPGFSTTGNPGNQASTTTALRRTRRLPRGPR